MTGTSTSTSTEYDAIVIGSGLGGLTTAALLARLDGKRVLVLERHYVLGGFTHTFRRPVSSRAKRAGGLVDGSAGRFEWDVGVHYVGALRPGSEGRRLFDFITDGQLDWQRMPDPHERFVFPGMTFNHPANKKRWVAALAERFPAEAGAIDRYLRDMKKAERWLGLWMVAGAAGPVLRKLSRVVLRRLGKTARGTVQAYMDRRFKDPELKAILTAQWGTYGVPPSQASFGVHALLVRHYMHGAWYPVGGAARIAETIVPVIEATGGKALTSREVQRVIVEDGKAVGVEATDNKGNVHTYRAPLIVSNTGALSTYERFIPEDLARPYVPKLRTQMQSAPSAAVVYFGLKDDPSTLGFDGANWWIYNHLDHEANAASAPVVAGKPPFAYVSFPSLKHPHARTHTMEAMCLMEAADVTKWRDERWRRRGDDYDALKARITQGMIDKIEQVAPGFADLVEHAEVSTPLSVEHFTGWSGGAIYGLPHRPVRYELDWLGVHTPLPGLRMTGADAFGFGVMGALFSGAAVVGFRRTLAAIRRDPPPTPAHPSLQVESSAG